MTLDVGQQFLGSNGPGTSISVVDYFNTASLLPFVVYGDDMQLMKGSVNGSDGFAFAVQESPAAPVVPEPGTWLLVGSGIAAALRARRRRSRL